MIRKTDILQGIKIATPCHASWDAMAGDERVRHCGACCLNVYNISQMSRTEAEELIRSKEGRLCIRMYQRTDGTVITKDCPVGVRALRRRLAFAATCVCALFLAVGAFASGKTRSFDNDGESTLWERMKIKVHQVEPLKSLFGWLDPPAQATTGVVPTQMMGDVAGPVTMGKPVQVTPADLKAFGLDKSGKPQKR